MQGKLFQRCTHLLSYSVMFLDVNVNTWQMSKPDIKNQWKTLVKWNYYVNYQNYQRTCQIFLSIKIVKNYKENMLKSASDSTYIFLLKIKNSVWFLYPLPPVYSGKAQYFAVHCSTLYPEALCIPCFHHFP